METVWGHWPTTSSHRASEFSSVKQRIPYSEVCVRFIGDSDSHGPLCPRPQGSAWKGDVSRDLTGITGAGVEATSQLVLWTFYNSPQEKIGCPPTQPSSKFFFFSSTLPPFLPILTSISSIGGLFLGKA